LEAARRSPGGRVAEGQGRIADYLPASSSPVHQPPELVGLQPDIILITGNVATAALQGETLTIPIVFAAATHPVGGGIVLRLNQPGVPLARGYGNA